VTRLDPGRAYCPDKAFNDSAHLSDVLRRRVLSLVTRPGRYTGGEMMTDQSPWSDDRVNFLLTYPDVYELGISNNGLRILYQAVNSHPDAWCDFVFTPWTDAEQQMRAEKLPLFGLQSSMAAKQFDVLGFSLGYELCYTNVLTMLDLAGIPVLADDRTDEDPLIIAGGHCATNPVVMGPFIDIFCIGDGEEITADIATVVKACKKEKVGREELVKRVREIPGTWYRGKTEMTYSRIVQDLNNHPIPQNIVPNIEATHDRLSMEVMRGCTRACRFCQAGMITRPVRERDVSSVVESAISGSRVLGVKEVSLLSLSTCDWSGLANASAQISNELKDTRVSMELPSLRVDALEDKLYDQVMNRAPTSFTFAPEAGTQRLRDVVNKNIDEKDILNATANAFKAGAKRIKLYFMIGLPTETDEDLDGAISLIRKLVQLAPGGGSQITASFSPFAPKAHTPFQWAGQISRDEINRRNGYLKDALRKTKIKVSLRAPKVSMLEATIGLGDEKLSAVVLEAWKNGARFDGWGDMLDIYLWEDAFQQFDINPDDYLQERNVADPLPWDNIFARVSRSFLEEDWEKSQTADLVEDCRLEGGCENCDACDETYDHVWAKTDELVELIPEKPKPKFDSRNCDPDNPEQELKHWINWRDRSPGKSWYRIAYKKTGDMAFLGHLDFQRQLQFALRRAELPAAYSQGFNPHPLLKFGPPLSLGLEGDYELMDIAFEKQTPGWERQLNRQLPDGIAIIDSELVGPSLPESIEQSVHRFDYTVTLPPESEEGPSLKDTAQKIEKFLASSEFKYIRRRPKGDVEIDIRSLIREIKLNTEQDIAKGVSFIYSQRRSNTSAGIPPHDFISALMGDLVSEPRQAVIRRTALLKELPDGEFESPLLRVREINQRNWLREKFAINP
jgi:radical SAM-linked protein